MIHAAVGTLLLALAAAVPPPQPQPPLPPQPGPLVAQVIALAVGEARCIGQAGTMLARYRPGIMAANADQIRASGQAMAQRYQQYYGDSWQATLNDDLVKLRTGFEQQANTTRFCTKTAWQARRMADAARYGQGGSSTGLAASAFRDPANVEDDVTRLYDRIR